MKLKFMALTATLLFVTNCVLVDTFQEDDETLETQNLVMGVLAGYVSAQSSATSTYLSLNGSWNSYTGGGATSNMITTISADGINTGVWLDDSSGFGGFSSCYRIVYFSNNDGVVITQNPENNGACFAGDTNKGKYNKVVFVSGTHNGVSVKWSCTVAFGQASVEDALAATNSSDQSDPANSGCGGFSWSRLEKK